MQVMSSVRTMFVHVYILSLQDDIHTYTQQGLLNLYIGVMSN
jgi:hypothetical protein